MNGTLSVDRPEQVITRAGADEGFKAALLANPKAALRSLGLEVPEGVRAWSGRNWIRPRGRPGEATVVTWVAPAGHAPACVVGVFG
jgi:hypothetical protein